MKLLEQFEDRGYPGEYLVSRIRGKRAGLISDWAPLVYSTAPFEHLASSRYRGFVTERSPEGIWRDLAREYRWVYIRLNSGLREIFRPFFIYCELRTIFICLRNINSGKVEKTGDTLMASLLSKDIKETLGESRDVSETVRHIERRLLEISDAFAGVADIFDREGMKGLERELTARYLATVVGRRLHPLIKDFFVRIIDARNIISLHKYIRLGPKTAPSFIPCGSISQAVFLRIIETKDVAEVGRLAGIRKPVPGLLNIETALYRKMTLFLKRAGRDPSGIGPVLDYLWRSSLEVTNLSLLYYGRDMERETVMTELVC